MKEELTALWRKQEVWRPQPGTAGRCPEIRRGQALGFGGVVSQSQTTSEEHRVIKAHVLRTPEVLLETA